MKKFNGRSTLLAALAIVSAIHSSRLYPDTPFYTKENALEYFSSKDNLAIISRISGGVHYGNYLYTLQGFRSDEFNEEAAIIDWEEYFSSQETATVAVISSIKGNMEPFIQVRLNEYVLIDLPLGENKMAFLDGPDNDGNYTLRPYESFSIDPEFNQQLNSDIENIVQIFVDGNL